MPKSINVEVFNDTKKKCKTNVKLINSINNSIEKQEIYLEKNQLPEMNREKHKAPAKIYITKNRTFQAAKGYKGNKVAILNFANPRYPGGHVANGSAAQEEALCRCSDLYFSLNSDKLKEEFYNPHINSYNPLHNDDLIYTPDVTFFKSDTSRPELLPEKDWTKVDVISCSAPYLGGFKPGTALKKVNISNEDLLKLHEKRLRRILDVAYMKGVDTVVLGAFGCGVYNNPPEIVAQAAKNVLKDYKHAFKNIEFAIYTTKKDDRNFNAFANAFGQELDNENVTIVDEPPKKAELKKTNVTKEEIEMNFACSAKLYKELIDSYIKELTALRDRLQKDGKRSKSKSYKDDIESSSDTYKKMTGCLDNAIETLQDRNSKHIDIKKSLYELYRSGFDYYNDHVGIIGPIRSFGSTRQNVADILTKTVPNMYNAHTYMKGHLSYIGDEDGAAYGGKSLEEIESKASELRDNMSDEDKAKVDSFIKPYSVDDFMLISKKQVAFIKKMRSVSRTFVNNYDYSKKPDEYLKLKRNMSITDKAKYILLKDIFDNIYRPNGEFEDISAAINGFKPKQFKESVNRLAADPAFRRCMERHPENGFSEWKKLQKNEKEIEKIKNIDHKPLSLH